MLLLLIENYPATLIDVSVHFCVIFGIFEMSCFSNNWILFLVTLVTKKLDLELVKTLQYLRVFGYWVILECDFFF